MLLIDELTAATPDGGQCTTTLKTTCIAGAHGEADMLIGVELLAQAFAAVKGWEAFQKGKKLPHGFLVGVRKYEATAPFPLGEPINITVKQNGEFEGFAIVEGTIEHNGNQLAIGKIKLWSPEEPV